MTRRSALLTTTALACVLGALATDQRAQAQRKAPEIVGATVIAESLPVGFRVSAVAVEYSDRLDLGPVTIPTSSFSVIATLEPESKIESGPRTITKAYTSDRPAR